MLSDLSKNAFKMASEDPQKNIAKSMKDMKLSGFLNALQGLKYQSYQLFEATFQ